MECFFEILRNVLAVYGIISLFNSGAQWIYRQYRQHRTKNHQNFVGDVEKYLQSRRLYGSPIRGEQWNNNLHYKCCQVNYCFVGVDQKTSEVVMDFPCNEWRNVLKVVPVPSEFEKLIGEFCENLREAHRDAQLYIYGVPGKTNTYTTDPYVHKGVVLKISYTVGSFMPGDRVQRPAVGVNFTGQNKF